VKVILGSGAAKTSPLLANVAPTTLQDTLYNLPDTCKYLLK